MINTRGFTLIELLVTMVVAGILFALAGPSFVRMLQARDLESEVSRWVGMVNYARTEAIKRNRQVSFCRRPESSLCDSDEDSDYNEHDCACDSDASAAYHPGFLVYVDNGDFGWFRGSTDGDLFLKLGIAANDPVEIRGNGTANRRFSFLPTGALHPRDTDGTIGGARHRFCYDGASTSALPGFEVVIAATGRPTVTRMDAGDSCAGG